MLLQATHIIHGLHRICIVPRRPARQAFLLNAATRVSNTPPFLIHSAAQDITAICALVNYCDDALGMPRPELSSGHARFPISPAHNILRTHEVDLPHPHPLHGAKVDDSDDVDGMRVSVGPRVGGGSVAVDGLGKGASADWDSPDAESEP